MPQPVRQGFEADGAGQVFRILTVCSGNLCRSPQAEQLMRVHIPAAFGHSRLRALDVASVGTMATDGDPMDPIAAAQAERLGVLDAGAHRTRRMSQPHVLQADLVLGMSREHRATVVRLVPAANRRAFTLIEFAGIVEALAGGATRVPVAPLGKTGFAAFMRGVVEAAATARGMMPLPGTPEELDVEDPYRRKPRVYRRSANAVNERVITIASQLARLAAAR